MATAAGNTSVFAGLCRSDPSCVQTAAFLIKSEYLPSATPIRILFVAAYTVRPLYIIGQLYNHTSVTDTAPKGKDQVSAQRWKLYEILYLLGQERYS